ncbi:hypothetical protein Hanom_Chr16g01418491 [Helianthus anomalus]
MKLVLLITMIFFLTATNDVPLWHCGTGRCGQGRLPDRCQPLGSPRCAETRPPPGRRHDSGIIGKTPPPIQVEPAPPVFALHLDTVENNEESGNRT